MLDALTVLRFFAAFCVFLHHAKDRLSIESWNLGPLGGFAMGFFSVLSGSILMHFYGGSLSAAGMSRFFVARFARIWPVHAIILMLFPKSGFGLGADWPLGFALSLTASLAAASLLHITVEVPVRDFVLAAWDGKLT